MAAKPHRLDVGIQNGSVSHLSVFGFERWRLLVRLGSLLNDNVPVDVYQRHRNGDTWAWPAHGAQVAFAVEVPDASDVGDDLAVVLNVSGTIQPNELPVEIRKLEAPRDR